MLSRRNIFIVVAIDVDVLGVFDVIDVDALYVIDVIDISFHR